MSFAKSQNLRENSKCGTYSEGIINHQSRYTCINIHENSNTFLAQLVEDSIILVLPFNSIASITFKSQLIRVIRVVSFLCDVQSHYFMYSFVVRFVLQFK